ncbi:MAG: nicotinamide-nucleotide amidohydrolase family protein [Clostridia bacterium]|nr:nicotinamide-nucleotide amidohydrolase family protein [Clostridia bacterium]
MDLIVMRHGTTNWNEQNIIQGRSQNRLSVRGIKVAKEAAEKLAYEKIDVIYCSPLFRAVQTANIVNKKQNVKIVKDERLTEIDQGIFTGRKKASLTPTEKEMRDAAGPGTKIEHCEHVIDRVEEFLDFLRDNEKCENVLVITHDICALAIKDLIDGINRDINDYRKLHLLKNAEFIKLKLERGNVYADKIVKILTKERKTISFMESCTGGALANEITNVSGSSEVFKFGAVTYSNEFKQKLGVDESKIKNYSVYSQEVADSMSMTISKFTSSDFGVGITGKLCAPDPANIDGEDNVVFISVYDKAKNEFLKKRVQVFCKSREKNKKIVIKNAEKLILNAIK